MRMKCNLSVFDIIIHILMWMVLSIITLGIAMIFFPYSFCKLVINASSITDESGFEQPLVCENNMFGNILNLILWFFISLITFGIGYIFFFYKVWNHSINNTRIGK